MFDIFYKNTPKGRFYTKQILRKYNRFLKINGEKEINEKMMNKLLENEKKAIFIKDNCGCGGGDSWQIG